MPAPFPRLWVDHVSIAVREIAPSSARSRSRPGYRTAYVHPHDASGILLQFWEGPELDGARRR